VHQRNPVLKWLGSPLGSALVVLAVAFLFRLLLLLTLHGSPYWSGQLVDAKVYDDWAVALTEGQNPHPAPYFYSPLYPWALSVVYRVFGHSLTAVRLLQCALGSLLCVLVCLLTRRLLSWQAALGAGLFCALFGPLIFFDNLLLKTAPVTFLLFAGVWLLITAEARRWHSHSCKSAFGTAEIRREKKDNNIIDKKDFSASSLRPSASLRLKHAFSFARFFLAGAAFGLAAGLRGNVVLVAAAVLLFLIVKAFRSRDFAFPGLFFFGLTVAILPLAISNYAASGEFILTTYSGGFNFYEGNSSEATGYHPALALVRQTAAHEHKDVVTVVREAIGRDPSPKEVSAYWSQKAWQDIGADPGRWCGLLALKAALFANRAEIPDNYNYSFMSARLWPLRRNPFGFHLLAPFAIVGLGMAIARGGRWWLIVLIVLAYTGSVVMFYVTARYRAPVVPFLAVLAALAVEQTARWLLEQDYQRVFVVVVVLFALFVAVATPLVPAELGFGREYYALGNMQMEQGNHEGAIDNYMYALEYEPGSVQLMNNLGAAYLRAAGQDQSNRQAYLTQGAAYLERAVERRPAYFEAWKNLGLARAASGDAESAQEAFLKALQLAPNRQKREKILRILESISQ
jgi:4-amino-4-deoxy-L-arabinose transferase-like glycosyltransferase